MQRYPKVLFETAIPKNSSGGDCYQVAAKLVIDSEVGTELVLVHAEVTGQGPLEGIKYGHAWVENIHGDVIDKSNGRDITINKQVYYSIGNISSKKGKMFKYTRREALDKMLDSEHFGPWDLKTEF